MNATIDDCDHLVINCAEYDLCKTCKNIRKCPLIQAVTQEIVILHYSEVAVSECGLYEKRKRRYEQN